MVFSRGALAVCFKNLFTYLFLVVLDLGCCVGFSLVSASRGYSPAVVRSLLIAWPPLLQSTGSRVHRLQWLWHTGLAALWHVGSSWTRDQTHVACIGRQILHH